MAGVVNWVRRHRRKFFVSGALVGGIYLVGKMAKWQMDKMREDEARKLMEKVRKQNHFSATESTCNHTLEALFPALRRGIQEKLDSDKITAVLRNKPEPADKIRFWEELKVIAVSRCLVLVLGGVFISVMLRIQLNVLAGHLYDQQLSGQARSLNNNADKSAISTKVQEKFLNSSTHFVSEGMARLCMLISGVVKRSTEGLSLKQKISLVEIEAIFNQIFDDYYNLEGDGNIFRNPGSFFLPDSDENFFTEFPESDQLLLKQMFVDCLDVVDSDDTRALVKQVCKQGLSHLVDRIAEYYTTIGKNSREPSPSADTRDGDRGDIFAGEEDKKNAHADEEDNKNRLHDSGFVSPTNVTLHLAKLIPILTAQARTLETEPDLWLAHLQDHSGIKVLGANVYEAFCLSRSDVREEMVGQESWGNFLVRSATTWL